MTRASLAVFAVVVGSSAMLAWVGCGSDEPAGEGTTEDGGGGEAGSSGSSGSSGVGGEGGVNPPNAGPGGDTTNVACGSTSCAIATQTCCIQPLGGGQTAYSCAGDGGCKPADGGSDEIASLKCTGQANCAAGTVCCVRVQNDIARSECKPSCNQDNEAQLCDPKLGDAGGCAAGRRCSSEDMSDFNLPNTFGRCRGGGGGNGSNGGNQN